MDRLLKGKRHWKIRQKLLEGDAGEVYTVVPADASIDEHFEAIAKCPKENPVYAVRQAAQIRLEGEILKILQAVQVPGDHYSIKTTRLLDSALIMEKKPENFFIVMEKAEGISLDNLHKLVQRGVWQKDLQAFSNAELIWARSISEQKAIPEFVLLACIDGVIRLLDFIHSHKTIFEGSEKSGIVWNDPKPNHVFWNAATRTVTVIDWGNGSFLEKDGITADRETNAPKDFIQFIAEFGKFLREVAPSLFRKLSWNLSPDLETISSDIQILKDNLGTILIKNTIRIQRLQEKENRILNSKNFSFSQIEDLFVVQKEIIAQGLLPDFDRAETLYFQILLAWAKDYKFSDCERLLDTISNQPLEQLERWALIEKLLMLKSQGRQNEIVFSKAIVAVCERNWQDILWYLADQISTNALVDIAKDVRRLAYGIEKVSYFPLEIFVELRNNLEHDSSQQQQVNRIIELWTIDPRKLDPASMESVLVDVTEDYFNGLLSSLDTQSITNREANTSYQPLEQPKVQSRAFKDNWQNQSFDTAQQILRRLLIFDPHRLRLLWAAEILLDAQNWLRDFKGFLVSDNQPKPNDLLENLVESVLQFTQFPREKRDSQIERLILRGKVYIRIFGTANWIAHRIRVLELLLRGTSAESELAYILESNPELWADFQILLGADYIEKRKEKEAESLSLSLSELLNKFYAELKRWNRLGIEELLEEPALAKWLPSYRRLVKAMEGSFRGIYENLDAVPFPAEDRYYKTAKYSIDIVNSWEEKLADEGFSHAQKYLNAHWAEFQDWSNVREAKRKQDDINNYASFFECLDQKKWKVCISWLETHLIHDNNELIEALHFLTDQSAKFKSDTVTWNPTMFTEIVGKSIFHAENLTSWLRTQRQKNPVFLASDWNQLITILQNIHNISSSLTRERISHWNYKKEGGERARTYLTKIKELETAITGKAERSTEWLSVARRIVDEKLSPQEAGLTDTHPIREWLLDYYEYKIPITKKVNWSTILVGIATVSIMLFAVVFGGRIMNAITSSSIPASPTQDIQDTPTTGEINPTATEIATQPITPTTEIPAILPTESVTPSEPATVCDRFAGYFKEKKWQEYSNELNKLGEAEYENARQICGYRYPYRLKLLDISLNQFEQRIENANTPKELRAITSDLRQLLEQNNISTDGLEGAPWDRRLETRNYSLDGYIKWLKSGIAFCTLNQGIPSIQGEAPRNKNLDLITGYLEQHIMKYDDGKNIFEETCGFEYDDIELKEIPLIPEQRVNLLQNWPGWTNETQPCLYFTDTIYHFRPELNNGLCLLPGLPQISNNQFAQLEAHLCIFEQDSTVPLSYGLLFDNIAISIDNLTPELISSPNATNQGCNSKQFVEIKGSRVGNLFLWQAQITDLRNNEPVYVPQEKPYSSLQVFPDELGYAPLNIFLWASPPESTHILINELFFYMQGGSQ